MNPLESDWKIYKELIPTLRDRFLQRKNEELIEILSLEGKTPTEKFWEAKERIDEQVEILNQCLGYHSRSKMWTSILMMHRYGLMEDQDLEGFSEPLRQDTLRYGKAVANAE